MLTAKARIIWLFSNTLVLIICAFFLSGCFGKEQQTAQHAGTAPLLQNVKLNSDAPLTLHYKVSGTLVKKISFEIEPMGDYASISLFADERLLLDGLDLPRAGRQTLSGLVEFDSTGDQTLKIQIFSAQAILHSLRIEDSEGLDIPRYVDITERAGIEKEVSLKYGGPTVADFNNDGHYDFILNNHNDKPTRLYWNKGDGTVEKHSKSFDRWFMQDLHGIAPGDYDNDGDLDLMVMMGGGNGKAPSVSNFYQNDAGNFVLYTGDVGITKGGRGRVAHWVDMDLDGDLDLMLFNESSLQGIKPQHIFYQNRGDKTFKQISVAGMEDQSGSRTLITDLNGDNIDDVIIYGSSLSVWQGNGDLTYTDITHQFPAEIRSLNQINAITDIDIDNDGDFDLYLARGKEFEHAKDEAPAIDLDPSTRELGIRTRAAKGVDEFSFGAQGAIKLHKYYYLTQGDFSGKDYPIFVGRGKTKRVVASGDSLDINPDDAKGWPDDISANGVYFGYLGDGQWRAALVRNGHNMFWSYRFALLGVHEVKPGFKPDNRNLNSFLLRNDNGSFTDISAQWGVPQGGNTMGVTRGDFNNDGFQDLFIYRWGTVTTRGTDLMLLNTGKAEFISVTMHGASDTRGPGNGDMGQAFDFNLDGKLDLLSGSELGYWYLYANQTPSDNHFSLVRVGYSPEHNVDPIGAEVKLITSSHEYRQRVGSAGSIFSPSLLNTMHFGLARENKIERIIVTWRNGEALELPTQLANTIIPIGVFEHQPNTQVPGQAVTAELSTMPSGPKIEAFIRVIDEAKYTQQEFSVGDELTLTVDYHAGSGNRVIAADEGGIRFWLRLFKSKWIPANDIVLTDTSVLGTQSGQSTMTIPLASLTPSAELPEGYFYALRVSFMSSNGNMQDTNLYPITIKSPK